MCDLAAAKAAARELLARPVASPAEVAECKAGRFEMGPVDYAVHDCEPPMVQRADPATMIYIGILCEILAGRCAQWVTYDAESHLLRIDGANRRVIYRIGRPVDERRSAFCMRWPD